MAACIPCMSDLLLVSCEAFEKQFGVRPEKVGCAPGRVNLIGEHTDYNEGFVLPMALQMVTVVVGRRTQNTSCRVLTLADVGEENYVEFSAPSDEQRLSTGRLHWSNYVVGVVQHYKGNVSPFDAVIVSSVPFGGGVSSSASLQVAVYTFLDELNDNQVEGVPMEEKARRCMTAEHEYIGLMDGIMDQFISFMAQENHALLLDCRSLDNSQIPIPGDSVSVLLANSNVRHELINTEYPVRTRQCKDAANALGVRSLRDATISDLQAKRDEMDRVLYKRAHHVIAETMRTKEAADALLYEDFETFGRLMVESHNSLRDDYEVSCTELDVLVSAALEVEGVYGSRMTGGGFGGCTVTLAKPSCIDLVIQNIQSKYSEATFYVCKPSRGAFGLVLQSPN